MPVNASRWRGQFICLLKLSPRFQTTTITIVISHCIKVCFFKTVVGKIASSRNLQKLPCWNEWNQRGSFCKFLDNAIFPSTFLKKQTLIEQPGQCVTGCQKICCWPDCKACINILVSTLAMGTQFEEEDRELQTNLFKGHFFKE